MPPALKTGAWRSSPCGLFVNPPECFVASGRFILAASTLAAGDMEHESARFDFLKRINPKSQHLAVGYQAHGTGIRVIRKPNDAPSRRLAGIDGWVAGGLEVGGVSLGVFTADCLAVYLLHSKESAAALLHVGWKGLAQGIIEQGVKTLLDEFSLDGKDLIAIIGPHVRSCCYNVKDEVAKLFPEDCKSVREGRVYLDLEKEVVRRLSGFGIGEFFVSTDCTKCSKTPLFFSKRRGTKGTQVALLSFL